MWRKKSDLVLTVWLGLVCCLPALCAITAQGAADEPLPGTKLLEMQGDLSVQMVSGIHSFLDLQTTASLTTRGQFWHCDFSSAENYSKSIEPNRRHLAKIIGAVDPRTPLKALEYISDTQTPAKIAETDSFTVFAVRWPVLPGVFAEGLWLKPKQTAHAQIVALPDADQTPEMLAGLASGINRESQFARILAEQGCEVLIPALVNREDTFSGNPKINRFTNQPHREWIYRQALQIGRHIIGYEVQKVLAAVDYFAGSPTAGRKVAVVGYGEGGLIAFYSAALDPRISAALVSGYFGPRQRLWQEPIYRNVFGLLEQFGDAEITAMILPRPLIVEYSREPSVVGPPPVRPGRAGAAPGRLATPSYKEIAQETERARALVRSGGNAFEKLTIISNPGETLVEPGSAPALTALLRELGVAPGKLVLTNEPPTDLRAHFNPAERQERQVSQLVDFTQLLFRDSARQRQLSFWNHVKLSSPEAFEDSTRQFKTYLWDEVFGRFAIEPLPLNARSRKVLEHEKWTGHDVVLDLYPGVFVWGCLLLPKDLQPGERRPVVVCQHGLEGVPNDVITDDPKSEGYHYYKSFAARLASEGFVVFAPHNPYRGGEKFRLLELKANPLKRTLFSVILAQHQQLLRWLAQQPFVDPARIGFYGLSYGGKTAVHAPPLLDGYALSICSASFTTWNQKQVSLDFSSSYMFTGEYEMPEFNLAPTLDCAEMATLIAPRPFMVERGHGDSVSPDEWVAAEYATVQRVYDQLGLSQRTRIEYLNGPHTIHGVGTFEFLREHLKWPLGGAKSPLIK